LPRYHCFHFYDNCITDSDPGLCDPLLEYRGEGPLGVGELIVQRIAIPTAFLMVVAACAKEQGAEGGACYPNGTCNDGLSCLSELCVDSSAGDGGEVARDFSVTGYVQKGPYVQGTEVEVRELDDALVPTGRTFVATIIDDEGTFTTAGRLEQRLIELSATGFYFNEVSGQLSAAPLTLQALADATDIETVNVNILTHLERGRVASLVRSGVDFATAKTQALGDILGAFNIEIENAPSAETLSISSVSLADAALLAVSAIVQANRTEAELTELLAVLAADLAPDGILNDDALRAELLRSVDYLKEHAADVRSNMLARYASIGRQIDVPDFERYLYRLDRDPPSIEGAYPADGAVGVNLAFGISMTFTEPLDTAAGGRLNTETTDCDGPIQLSQSDFQSCIPFESSSLGWISSRQLYVMPRGPFESGATHKIRFSPGLADLAGNAFGAQPPLLFTTTRWQERAAPTMHRPTTPEVVGRTIFLFGGDGPSGLSEVSDCYDIVADSWNRCAPMPTLRRTSATAVYDGLIHILGGDGYMGGGSKYATHEVYDPATDSWSARQSLPEERYLAAAEAVDGKIYVFGGFFGGSRTTSVIAYDIASDSWSDAPADLPSRRAYATAAAVGRKIYVLGGNPDDGDMALEYDIDSNTYRSVSTIPNSGATIMASATIGERIYMLQGGSFGTFDPVADTWTPMESFPFGDEGPFALVTDGTSVFAVADRVFRLNLD
jgi:hypothetical protein